MADDLDDLDALLDEPYKKVKVTLQHLLDEKKIKFGDLRECCSVFQNDTYIHSY